ncbi:ankyrin repeat domain-containing protein [Tenacibaculum sp. UWU-22]|uniref:ankyrin repeat domain-containing protein n=1 Tax=Tenacibaculum sp. UWU-22 TaxID=3234187 RepID=UPI0034DAD842
MKKLIITTLLIVLSFESISASTQPHLTKATTSLKKSGVSVFCKLITTGNYAVVKVMIENGTDINKKSTGLTPLMFAARYNRAKIAQLLIDNGAKLTVKSDNGYTAIEYAKMSKANDALAVLKKALKK